jgi:type II restriction enzyme
MSTDKQILGQKGEEIVCKDFSCPKCKKEKTLKKLVNNFKCADVICDFCGYLAQVKTKTVKNIDIVPNKVLGAAWKPQKERMESGIYFPLFLVLVKENFKKYSVFYLSADLQKPEMFIVRKPLSNNAKRAGWQGFYYDGQIMKNRMTRIK